jgi:hypothetical protein
LLVAPRRKKLLKPLRLLKLPLLLLKPLLLLLKPLLLPLTPLPPLLLTLPLLRLLMPLLLRLLLPPSNSGSSAFALMRRQKTPTCRGFLLRRIPTILYS